MIDFNFKHAEAIIFPFIKNSHDLEHTKRVVNYGMLIALSECPDKMNDVLVGCYLHDFLASRYKNNKDHAIIGSQFAEKVIKKYFNNCDTERIIHAIKYHEDERITTDPVIGAIWDADRLDNINIGRLFDLNTVSTSRGIEIALNNGLID